MVSHALRQIWEYRLSLVLILTPLLLLPLPLAAPGKVSEVCCMHHLNKTVVLIACNGKVVQVETALKTICQLVFIGLRFPFREIEVKSEVQVFLHPVCIEILYLLMWTLVRWHT